MISLSHLTKFQKRVFSITLILVGITGFFYALYLLTLLQIIGVYIIKLDIAVVIILMGISMLLTFIACMIFAISRLRSMFKEMKVRRNEQRL
jgi:hypothetical protein